jgi:hypothetical protein
MSNDLTIETPVAGESPAGEFELGTWLIRRQAFGVVILQPSDLRARAQHADCVEFRATVTPRPGLATVRVFGIGFPRRQMGSLIIPLAAVK